jgi:chromosome segregation ATPase
MSKLQKIKSNGSEMSRDQFTVILEAIQSDFRLFGEKLDFIDERLSGQLRGVEARLDRIEARLDRVEARLDRVEARLDSIEGRLDTIEAELIEIKGELSDLKTKLDKTADLERLLRLEHRVEQLEAELAVLGKRQ